MQLKFLYIKNWSASRSQKIDKWKVPFQINKGTKCDPIKVLIVVWAVDNMRPTEEKTAAKH